MFERPPILLRTMIVLLAAALPSGARAQAGPAAAGGVEESTDPARAAAVEQAAREAKARAALQPRVAAGIVRGRTDAGSAYLSGGISLGDRLAMHAERERYSLWVATVARPSGAYLADVKLRIVDLGSQAVVLQRTMDGPWLMAALPAGRYEVAATFRDDGSDQDQTLTERVDVAAGVQRQVVLRFDSKALVGSEMDGPFKDNPFGAPPAGR